jgi:hypothetical protein
LNRRLQWIQHKGKRILQVDARNVGREEQAELGPAYAAAFEKEKEGSVLVLVVAEGFDFYSDLMIKHKRHLLSAQPKVRRSALVGVTGILKVALEGFYSMARLLGLNVSDERGRHFKTVEEAKDWLVS